MSESLFEPQEGGQQNPNVDPNQGQQAPQASEPNGGQSVDPNSLFSDQLAGIKDENGRQKYADVNTALTSLGHAQGHISNLENQVAELQGQLNQQQGMEQVLERIEASRQTNTEQPSVNGLSKADVLAIVQQKEAAEIAYANEVAVTKALTEKFGDKAMEQLELKASELGVNVDFLQSIAQKSPKAVLNYFEVSSTPNSNPTSGGVNTEALNTNVAPSPDAVAEAKAKLMGQSSPLVNRWRAAAQQTN